MSYTGADRVDQRVVCNNMVPCSTAKKVTRDDTNWPFQWDQVFTTVSALCNKYPFGVYSGYNPSNGVNRCNGNSYDPKNLVDCCIGLKRGSHDCPNCWCPGQPKCHEALKSYCAVPDTSGVARMETDTKCQTWCNQFPQECAQFKSDYCRGHRLETEMCRTYCAEKDTNCDAKLEEYCNSIGVEQALKSPLCGCFLGDGFYGNYFKSLTAQVSSPSGIPPIKECYFPKCASSNMKPYQYKQEATTCPDVNQCINEVNINNDGSIEGNINIIGENECQFVQKTTTACDPNAIDLKNPACQTYCQNNPALETCNAALDTLCHETVNKVPKIFLNPLCVPWCNNNTEECAKIQTQYCASDPFDEANCHEWCESNPEPCLQARKQHCLTYPSNTECGGGSGPPVEPKPNTTQYYAGISLIVLGVIIILGGVLIKRKGLSIVGILFILIGVALYFLSRRQVGCKNDADCPIGTHCLNGKCVPCKTDADCLIGQYCSTTNQCSSNLECQTDTDCKTSTAKRCSANQECVPCLESKDCERGQCLNNRCFQNCYSNVDCPSTQPICNEATGTCTVCLNDSQCAGTTTKPYCKVGVAGSGSSSCVECLSDTNCPAGKPRCVRNRCQPCVTNADCKSGTYCDSSTNQCLPGPVCMIRIKWIIPVINEEAYWAALRTEQGPSLDLWNGTVTGVIPIIKRTNLTDEFLIDWTYNTSDYTFGLLAYPNYILNSSLLFEVRTITTNPLKIVIADNNIISAINDPNNLRYFAIIPSIFGGVNLISDRLSATSFIFETQNNCPIKGIYLGAKCITDTDCEPGYFCDPQVDQCLIIPKCDIRIKIPITIVSVSYEYYMAAMKSDSIPILSPEGIPLIDKPKLTSSHLIDWLYDKYNHTLSLVAYPKYVISINLKLELAAIGTVPLKVEIKPVSATNPNKTIVVINDPNNLKYFMFNFGKEIITLTSDATKRAVFSFEVKNECEI